MPPFPLPPQTTMCPKFLITTTKLVKISKGFVMWLKPLTKGSVLQACECMFLWPMLPDYEDFKHGAGHLRPQVVAKSSVAVLGSMTNRP